MSASTIFVGRINRGSLVTLSVMWFMWPKENSKYSKLPLVKLNELDQLGSWRAGCSLPVQSQSPAWLVVAMIMRSGSVY